jgi:hypothetical protein
LRALPLSPASIAAFPILKHFNPSSLLLSMAAENSPPRKQTSKLCFLQMCAGCRILLSSHMPHQIVNTRISTPQTSGRRSTKKKKNQARQKQNNLKTSATTFRREKIRQKREKRKRCGSKMST